MRTFRAESLFCECYESGGWWVRGEGVWDGGTTTRPPCSHHATTTQPPRNHTATTMQPQRNHRAATAQPPRNQHTTTAQTSRNHHATTTHATTTHSVHRLQRRRAQVGTRLFWSTGTGTVDQKSRYPLLRFLRLGPSAAICSLLIVVLSRTEPSPKTTQDRTLIIILTQIEMHGLV